MGGRGGRSSVMHSRDGSDIGRGNRLSRLHISSPTSNKDDEDLVSRLQGAVAHPGCEMQRDQAPANLDEELVRAALRGDAHAFRQLYDRHHAYVAAIAWRLVRRHATAEDLVQDTFVTAFETLDRLREPSRVRPWLGTIVTRMAGRRLDRQRRWSTILRALRVTRIEATPEDEGDAAALFEVLDRLPSRLRTPWILARVEGQQLADVARMCECSLATVKRRIAAAQREVEGGLA